MGWRQTVSLRFWTHFLPELDLFESKKMRLLAASRAINNVSTWLSMSTMFIAIIVAEHYLVPILASMFLQSPFIAETIIMAPWFIAILFAPWLTRKHIRRKLRQELIKDGFPICVPCGYDLRGLAQPRCPECGSLFDEELLKKDYRRRARKKHGLCVKCGYDLRGSKDRCPECGTEFETT